MTKGLIIGGEFGNILVRQKNEQALELGELMIAETADGQILLQAFDLLYGSQLTQQNLEMISGLKLEEDEKLEFMDAKLRNYVLARLKNLAFIQKQNSRACKTLPTFFTKVREITAEDVTFLTTPQNPLFLGKLRSGSKVLEVPVSIDGQKALSHHILIAGTTGRGKSVLMTNLLWNTLGQQYCSMLVLDPHDEYYEKLRKHTEARDKLLYYTPRNPPPGARTLKIHLGQLIPKHFDGVYDWTDAQKQAVTAYHHTYKDSWIEAVLREQPLNQQFHEGTLAVVKRTLMQLLRLDVDEEKNITSAGIFDTNSGQTTIPDIVNALESGKTVIIDTSSFHGNIEILIGSMIASVVLEKHKTYSLQEMKMKPVVSVVLEEAPRVLGKEVLERGPNIFSTIAREGRKFNVGLTAITQLPSLIPREILANINTKIILGIELKPERQAIIESAAQDLSSDERMIASLDKGEAIVTSNFLSFAMPIKIPHEEHKEVKQKQAFVGLKL
ncbi:MAG TPA: ATP-binding protein [Candidatus Nanoarchaeia archaeon]|nr:ATP-binding protein [Candidatus Nanoarchaeia archaeon]